MKKDIILISHGNMSVETLKSAEMILGKTERFSAIGFYDNESPEILEDKIAKEIGCSLQSPVWIIVDLFGGTPFNVALKLKQYYSNIEIITGLSLGLVIESSFYPMILDHQLLYHLVDTARQSIQYVSAESSDDDEVES